MIPPDAEALIVRIAELEARTRNADNPGAYANSVARNLRAQYAEDGGKALGILAHRRGLSASISTPAPVQTVKASRLVECRTCGKMFYPTGRAITLNEHGWAVSVDPCAWAKSGKLEDCGAE
jgi:hypothetical protein